MRSTKKLALSAARTTTSEIPSTSTSTTIACERVCVWIGRLLYLGDACLHRSFVDPIFTATDLAHLRLPSSSYQSGPQSPELVPPGLLSTDILRSLRVSSSRQGWMDGRKKDSL